MSNPRQPVRLAEYDESGSYYPSELTHKDGVLFLIGSDGDSVTELGGTVKLDDYDNDKTFNEKELTHKDGVLYFTEDGKTTPLYDSRISDLESKMADLLYEAIDITSFSHNKGTLERGVVVNSVTLSWAINKTPTSLTLDGETLDVGLRSKDITGLNITWDNNKTWKLQASDEREATDSATTSITFYNGVYYGVAVAQESYDSSFILGFKANKKLRSNKLPSFSITANENEYIYYCLPKRMGTCSFTVGGFSGGFELVGTIDFENESGYTEPYYIYKSNNASLGATSVSVS